MNYSSLFKLKSSDLTSEAEVETRLLSKLFTDLGYPVKSIIPKKRLSPLIVNDGSKRRSIEADFLLKDINGNVKIAVEAKDPKYNLQNAWGQTASYALSFNRDKSGEEKIKWLLISNGYITSLYRHDSDVPTVTLRLSDFRSGSPPYVTLRTHIKFAIRPKRFPKGISFQSVTPDKLNLLFSKCHHLVWKKEKLNPTDAFFEFCKFIFIKIREDKIRERMPENTPTHEIPLTLKWLKAQEATSKHPTRDILFAKLHKELETAINKEKKKRIFDKEERLCLHASTCKELIDNFESINLSSIDEDLNGRMFEVFLAAESRGKALGQYFTPRPVVDFMTRIGLRDCNIENPPIVIDACSGTAGFLIEVMAYLLSELRGDTRYNKREKEKIKDKICNSNLYGIEANERVVRIARINMYLHGDGGSHIFHGDGLDNNPYSSEDMTDERIDEVKDHIKKISSNSFDLVLTNPPFSMSYKSENEDENKILNQRSLARGTKTAQSNMLYLDRYHELLKPSGEILIILDDTILNGSTFNRVREWMLEKFIVLGVHSLPFNAFFKAKANIKTSILHLRKKDNKNEEQGHVFMSISNNIGHDNHLKDTPDRNNLNDILNTYLEWKRTGTIDVVNKDNQDKSENLECPEQIWIVSPEKFIIERFDSFFYSPELHDTFSKLEKMEKNKEIKIHYGKDLVLGKKFTKTEKKKLRAENEMFKYIEIRDVTRYGLITKYIESTFDALPSRGQYQIKTGDLLLAINNSSRGTVVKVPKDFNDAICTSGFLVIKPKNEEESNLLWYSLRSEFCRKQIYYLAQTASQPELKLEAWAKYFMIPVPKGRKKNEAISKSKTFLKHIDALLDADSFRFE